MDFALTQAPCGFFNFMDYKDFTIKYHAQLALGVLVNRLYEIQYDNSPLIKSLIEEADKIGVELGGKYFEDCYWLIAPLSSQQAFQLHRSKFKK